MKKYHSAICVCVDCLRRKITNQKTKGTALLTIKALIESHKRILRTGFKTIGSPGVPIRRIGVRGWEKPLLQKKIEQYSAILGLFKADTILDKS